MTELSKPSLQMQSLSPAVLLPNICGGLIAGIVSFVYSISFAALIFSGSLTQFFPQGVGTALVGATVTAVIVAWRSGFPFALAGPDSNSAVILALMAGAIAHTLEAAHTPERLYPTVWAAIIGSSLLVGIVLYILGRLRLGQWARYIPYPVIGGFLAGTGWLITRSSFKVMTGIPLDLTHLSQLFQIEVLPRWLVGVSFVSIVFWATHRYRHFLMLPGLIVAAIASFHLFWGLGYAYFPAIDRADWFFKPFSTADLWRSWQPDTVTQIDWLVLSQQSTTLIALTLIVVISILLNATGVELAISRDVDLNRELRANGIANCINGLLGGMVGFLSVNRTLLNYQAGATSPLSGIIAGGLCGTVLIFGSAFLAYLPKTILGGLLLYVGLGLLLKWIYQAWYQFSRLDYALIVLILLVIALLGFLQGIGMGLVIACFLFIVNYGRTPVVKHTLTRTTYQSNVHRSKSQQRLLEQQGDCVYILVLQGFIFFGTANTLLENVRRRLADPTLPPLQFVVFDFRLVSGLDSSGVLSFIKLKQLLQKAGIALILTQLQPNIQQQLDQGNLFLPEEKTCYVFDDLDWGIEWCETQILEASQLRRQRFIPLALQLEPLFPEPGQAAKLMQYLKPISLEADSYLFRQGDAFDGLYFLQSGRVNVVLELPNGQAKRLRSYTAGNIVGEMGLYQQAPRNASVIANQPCTFYFLSNKAFEQIEQEDPLLAASFHKYVVNLLAERLNHREKELKTLFQ